MSLKPEGRIVELDWLNPTAVPAPSPGMEYSLNALDEPVNVFEGAYGDRPVQPHSKTTIRGAALVSCGKPRAQVVLGPERPNRKPD